MKCLNCMGCQILLLLGLALVGGGGANLARSGNPEKFLPWTTDLYAAPEPAPRGTASPAPKPDTPPPADPASESPSDPERPVAPGSEQPGEVADAGDTPDADIPDADPADDPGADEEGEFPKIGFEAALEEYEVGTTFVDARRTKDYVEGHITGAISISPYEQSVLAEKIARVAEEVPEEAPVVVYCTASADCEDSAMISRQLQAAGLQNISIYKGGFPEWDAKLRNDERRSRLITRGAEPGERDL